MKLEYYINWTKSTCADLSEKKLSSEDLDNYHMLFGMETEVGELTDVFKKNLAYNREIDWVNVKEELGDLMYYIASFCRINDIDLEEVIENNVAKLETRYPNNFEEEKALNRNLDKERLVLENGEDNKP